MITFDKHTGYFGNSLVIGNYCWNGCQFFHKDRAQDVFDSYKVPEDYQLDIMEAFSDEGIPQQH